VILPDLNLLVHAYNADAKQHPAAKKWWENALAGSEPVFLAWTVMLGFVRLVTQPRLLANPYPPADASAIVESWLAQPIVSIVHPGERHARILFQLLRGVGTAGNLTSDAHLAAIAIEHELTLHSTDSDFARFPGLRWIDPITGSSSPGRRTRR
jgi:toxin-antitoxin system PIN domain toxin